MEAETVLLRAGQLETERRAAGADTSLAAESGQQTLSDVLQCFLYVDFAVTSFAQDQGRQTKLQKKILKETLF